MVENTFLGSLGVRWPGSLMLRAGLTFAALVALLAPAAWSSSTEPYAPTAATALAVQGAGALVNWIPGLVPADSFNVYGFTPQGDKTPLAVNVTQTTVEVPTGFASYAVSGIKNGIESQLVPATSGCVVISTDPPDVGYVDCFAGRTTTKITFSRAMVLA